VFRSAPYLSRLYFHRPYICLLFLVIAFAACEDNIEDPTLAVTFGPPQYPQALSVNGSTVSLTWLPGVGSSDETFVGYIVEFGSIEDSIPKSNIFYIADALPAGSVLFNLYSYRTDGPRSDVASIRWAAADRFDTPLELTEYFVQDPQRQSGLDLGSQSDDPSTIQIEPIDTVVLAKMDCFLHGGSGVVSDSLQLWSAYLYRSDLRRTFFSTVRHSAQSLDYPLATFPASGTFSRDTITVADNTIYYARLTGVSRFDTLYARFHVQIVDGLAFPFRKIIITVSLQRVPGVPYAVRFRDYRPDVERLINDVPPGSG
jgi:hypothetical protein